MSVDKGLRSGRSLGDAICFALLASLSRVRSLGCWDRIAIAFLTRAKSLVAVVEVLP